MEENPSKLTPALIGGAVIGILSTLPIINLGNCLCCMWILIGGFIGTYLYSRDLPAEHSLSGGDGAIIGLLSGIFGALFGAFLGYFLMAVLGFNPGKHIVESLLESKRNISPEMRELLERVREREGINPFFVFIGLFFSLIINSIFGTIGGIMGAAIFKKQRRKTNSWKIHSETD